MINKVEKSSGEQVLEVVIKNVKDPKKNQ